MINQRFMRLTTDQIWELWRTIRWPKSHIAGVAKLLASLKNRGNRFPGLTRAQFAARRNAIGVIATEYNMGATSSTSTDARPSLYGTHVADICLDETVVPEIFSNFTNV